MTPLEYLEIVVLPTVQEFLEQPGNPRRAYLSAITAFHLIDYVMHVTPEPDRKARRAGLKMLSPGRFEVVEGLCHGSKHCGCDRPSYKFTPGDEELERSFGFAEAGDAAPFGQGPFGLPRLKVQHDGRDYRVDEAVTTFLRACQEAFPEHLAGPDLTELRVRPH